MWSHRCLRTAGSARQSGALDGESCNDYTALAGPRSRKRVVLVGRASLYLPTMVGSTTYVPESACGSSIPHSPRGHDGGCDCHGLLPDSAGLVVLGRGCSRVSCSVAKARASLMALDIRRAAGSLVLGCHLRHCVPGSPPQELVSTLPWAMGRKAIDSSGGHVSLGVGFDEAGAGFHNPPTQQ